MKKPPPSLPTSPYLEKNRGGMFDISELKDVARRALSNNTVGNREDILKKKLKVIGLSPFGRNYSIDGSDMFSIADSMNKILDNRKEIESLGCEFADASKFCQEIGKLSRTSEFQEKVIGIIGTPERNESEDEFVIRAKKKLAAFLRKEFG